MPCKARHTGGLSFTRAVLSLVPAQNAYMLHCSNA